MQLMRQAQEEMEISHAEAQRSGKAVWVRSALFRFSKRHMQTFFLRKLSLLRIEGSKLLNPKMQGCCNM